jgi:hypothetical protein
LAASIAGSIDFFAKGVDNVRPLHFFCASFDSARTSGAALSIEFTKSAFSTNPMPVLGAAKGHLIQALGLS